VIINLQCVGFMAENLPVCEKFSEGSNWLTQINCKNVIKRVTFADCVQKVRKIQNTNIEHHHTLTGFEVEVDISCFKSDSRDLHSSSLRFLTMYSYVVKLLITVVRRNK